mmetsp:Transcript_116767/g.267997  ORF Transcript_116767/g.267997 Transcript_116767/m.267997 type:complete len:199 (+) Transcript_116767:2-598(+)
MTPPPMQQSYDPYSQMLHQSMQNHQAHQPPPQTMTMSPPMHPTPTPQPPPSVPMLGDQSHAAFATVQQLAANVSSLFSHAAQVAPATTPGGQMLHHLINQQMMLVMQLQQQLPALTPAQALDSAASLPMPGLLPSVAGLDTTIPGLPTSIPGLSMGANPFDAAGDLGSSLSRMSMNPAGNPFGDTSPVPKAANPFDMF